MITLLLTLLFGTYTHFDDDTVKALAFEGVIIPDSVTSAIWADSAHTLQGRDTSYFKVDSIRYYPHTSDDTFRIYTGHGIFKLKVTYIDTAGYALLSAFGDSARVAGNSWLCYDKDTTTTGSYNSGTATITLNERNRGTAFTLVARPDSVFKSHKSDSADYADSTALAYNSRNSQHSNKARFNDFDSLVDITKGRGSGYVAIMFDDGHSNDTITWRIAKEIGVPVTFSMITDSINNGRFLDSVAINSMYNDGAGFASHSKTHAGFSGLFLYQTEIELRESKRRLETVIQNPDYECISFVYPAGVIYTNHQMNATGRVYYCARSIDTYTKGITDSVKYWNPLMCYGVSRLTWQRDISGFIDSATTCVAIDSTLRAIRDNKLFATYYMHSYSDDTVKIRLLFQRIKAFQDSVIVGKFEDINMFLSRNHTPSINATYNKIEMGKNTVVNGSVTATNFQGTWKTWDTANVFVDSINQRANRYLRVWQRAKGCSTLIHQADTSLYSLNSGLIGGHTYASVCSVKANTAILADTAIKVRGDSVYKSHTSDTANYAKNADSLNHFPGSSYLRSDAPDTALYHHYIFRGHKDSIPWTEQATVQFDLDGGNNVDSNSTAFMCDYGQVRYNNFCYAAGGDVLETQASSRFSKLYGHTGRVSTTYKAFEGISQSQWGDSIIGATLLGVDGWGYNLNNTTTRETNVMGLRGYTANNCNTGSQTGLGLYLGVGGSVGLGAQTGAQILMGGKTNYDMKGIDLTMTPDSLHGSHNAYGYKVGLTSGGKATTAYSFGVYSNVNDTASGRAYGGYFEGTTKGNTGWCYGIYAKTNNTNKLWGGYFVGNVETTDTVIAPKVRTVRLQGTADSSLVSANSHTSDTADYAINGFDTSKYYVRTNVNGESWTDGTDSTVIKKEGVFINNSQFTSGDLTIRTDMYTAQAVANQIDIRDTFNTASTLMHNVFFMSDSTDTTLITTTKVRSDTADFITYLNLPASDSSLVSANSHTLQTLDTTALKVRMDTKDNAVRDDIRDTVLLIKSPTSVLADTAIKVRDDSVLASARFGGKIPTDFLLSVGDTGTGNYLFNQTIGSRFITNGTSTPALNGIYTTTTNKGSGMAIGLQGVAFDSGSGAKYGGYFYGHGATNGKGFGVYAEGDSVGLIVTSNATNKNYAIKATGNILCSDTVIAATTRSDSLIGGIRKQATCVLADSSTASARTTTAVSVQGKDTTTLITTTGTAQIKTGDFGVRGILSLSARTTVTCTNIDTNYIPVTATFLSITGPTAAFSIKGIATPTGNAVIFLMNNTAQNMTLKNLAVNQATGYTRINNLTAGDIVTTGGAMIILIYDGTGGSWTVAGSQL